MSYSRHCNLCTELYRSQTHGSQCRRKGHQISAIHSSRIGVHSNWAYSHLQRQRFRDQDRQSQSTHWSLTSCGNQIFCTTALATHEGYHFDPPPWGRESCGHAHKSSRLGPPPSSCALPHGELWQSLPVNLSWFYFQLLFPPRQHEFYWILSLTIYISFHLICFGLALSIQLWCDLFRIRGGCQRASCATYERDQYTLLHERLSTDQARSRTMQRHWDDLKTITQQELTLSIFHTKRSLIRLVFITSHLVYYSTLTSLDL